MKSLTSFIAEGSDFHCNKCGDNLGKATENHKKAYCGTCGHTSNNPSGHDPEPAAKPAAAKKAEDHIYPKIKETARTAENPSGRHFKVRKTGTHKYVDHGNGYFTKTGPYRTHIEYGHLGVKTATTLIHHIDTRGYKSEVGHIDHTKTADGTESHSLTHRPSNHTFSGGAVDDLKSAVEKVKATHVAQLKHHGCYDDGYNHGHHCKFIEKED